MKRLNLIISMVTLVLVLFAVGCGGTVAPAPNVDATVAAAVAATRTASDIQEKVAATLSALTPTTAPPILTVESASIVEKLVDKVLPLSEHHVNTGVEYVEAGHHEIAIQEYTKAIRLDPDYALAYYNRGSSYAHLGEYQAAINDFDNVIQIDPDNADAYHNRGRSYDQLGERHNAINDYTKAIQLDPDYADYPLGRYHQGRTLHINVMSIERVPELHYSTIDPEQVIRRWRLTPSANDTELVLVRMKVENHTAVSAIVNVDRAGAELRDFSNGSYFPLSVEESVYRDLRAESEAQIRMSLG